MRRLNAYDRALQKLWEDILFMGEKVTKALDFSIEALIEQNEEKAKKVFQIEKKIDQLDVEIDMGVFELISIQQPMTAELRKLAGIMKIEGNLENIGDYAVNIAEFAIKLSKLGNYFKPLVDIPKMAKMAREMIDNALTAYSTEDTQLAMAVIKSDTEIDEIYKLLFGELLDYMKKSPEYVEQATYLLFIAKDLEKIGDHAENIAEMVNFMVSGSKRV